jgi:predicted O-linked N-acetylglucosamine transferase (SPINDLY family)
LLEAHDRHRVEVVCYDVSPAHDSATDQMRGLSDRWREFAGSKDEQLVAAIRSDRIDILVDLAGHCPGNRLTAFARRAAPIQLTWFDYGDTTGVPAMDYFLSTELLTPAHGQQRFTENVVCAAEVIAPRRPLMTAMQSPAPARAVGYVTFGCINRMSKLCPPVIATWSELLKRVPGSRLLLQATAFASPEPKSTITQRFAAYGIAPGRLDLRPFSDEATMFRAYAEIDIALDPFPYNGATTTCDALSMGVPVVSLEGVSVNGRHGVSILSACGMREWLASTPEEYIETAVRAASDPEALARLRAELPARFNESANCDPPGFARRLEDLYVRLWAAWCNERDAQ